MFKSNKQNQSQIQNQQQSQSSSKGRSRSNIHISSVGLTIALVIFYIGILGAKSVPDVPIGIYWVVISLLSLFFLFAIQVANQWEKAVVLRLGKFRGLRGPGLFWILPIIDSTANWIDHRVMVSPFNAEKTLTNDAM